MDDELLFIEEVDVQDTKIAEQIKVLIVDDEEEVHIVTKLVLNGFIFEGKKIQLLSVYSASEAREILTKHEDIALILLDVVMERADAGLQLVKYIREVMDNKLVRIVLRTGQPGEAPEARVIVEYDINDYKEKTELTAQKLLTTLISALRSHRDLMTIAMNKRGLEKIIESSPEIFRMQSMQNFATGVLMQLIAMLRLNKNSLYLKVSSFAATCKKDGEIKILAATGEFDQDQNENLSEDIRSKLDYVLTTKQSIFLEDYFILYWQSADDYVYLIYMEGDQRLSDLDKRLLDVFCLNVSSAFENLKLHLEMYDTQREVFFRLAEVAETRSKETGNHVRRVAEYARLLAIKYGLSENEVDTIHLAAPMHDIGKLGIPDEILNKPGKLTPAEFEVIKHHTDIGYDMLKGSPLHMLQAAAIIAKQHHERYDGRGYASGLQGDEIHIFARITAIADVFDALCCDRVYKKAWPLEDVLAYFQEAKGTQFDPQLVELLFSNLNEFLQVQEKFADDFHYTKI
ncbi:MAG: response regulator receiver modulated metal dependent phosphohydrolase [Pelosinus sp.]|jgi:response regulator RpfG family c-di-GMP phosphodiesterase|nr:response regulator receiver modulated metal dependent phosphohydrolase [Pelosinus sp.]